MKTFKQHLDESPEELQRRYAHMRKSELDGSGLETRGEKMKYTRAKNSFFSLLNKMHPDETKQKVEYARIADKHDGHHQ